MKSTLHYCLVPLVLLLAHLVASCTTPVRSQPTAMLAVRVVGGGSPTTQQTARIHNALESYLSRTGLRFAERLSDADFVVSVDFAPDAMDPNQGRVKITGVESSSRLRRANGDEMSVEAKEWAQKLREYERWIERQAKEST